MVIFSAPTDYGILKLKAIGTLEDLKWAAYFEQFSCMPNIWSKSKTSTLYNSHWLSGSPGILRFQPPEPALRSPLFLLFLGKWISEAKRDFNVDCSWAVDALPAALASDAGGAGLKLSSSALFPTSWFLSKDISWLIAKMCPTSDTSLCMRMLSTICSYNT